MTSYRKNVYIACVDFREMFQYCYDCLVVSDSPDKIQLISDSKSFDFASSRYLETHAQIAKSAFKKFALKGGDQTYPTGCEISADLFYDEYDLDSVTYASQRITVGEIPYFIPA